MISYLAYIQSPSREGGLEKRLQNIFIAIYVLNISQIQNRSELPFASFDFVVIVVVAVPGAVPGTSSATEMSTVDNFVLCYSSHTRHNPLDDMAVYYSSILYV